MGLIQEFREFASRKRHRSRGRSRARRGLGGIVASLVDDVLMPPLGYLFGGVDFANLFRTLGPGEYPTLEAAKEQGPPLSTTEISINRS